MVPRSKSEKVKKVEKCEKSADYERKTKRLWGKRGVAVKRGGINLADCDEKWGEERRERRRVTRSPKIRRVV